MEEKSYLQTRLDELGITPELNSVSLFYENPDNGIKNKVKVPIFTSDKEDNIEILYYDIQGNAIEYPKPETLEKDYYNRFVDYRRIRWREPEKHGGNKYMSPAGQPSLPFFPPAILKVFAKKEKINTLYITEGEFKAFKACMHGFLCVGIAGIKMIADKHTKSLYPDLMRLITACEVKNIVFIMDGDCLEISLNDLKEKRELTRRPNDFFQAVLALKDKTENIGSVKNFFFAHIKTRELKDYPKGLDDLLVAYQGNEKEVFNDIRDPANGGIYFYRLNITLHIKKLKTYFMLQNETIFYEYHKLYIGANEFVFNGTTYQYNEKENKVKLIVSKELKAFFRVGDDYFENVEKINIRTGNMEEVRVKRKKTTITDDFGKKSIDNIPKYKMFINYPSNIDYKRIINGCYNMYNPISHEPKDGEWDNIKKLFQHIWAEQYEYGLDYVQLLYQQPLQILPILCLVSKENTTGKSTFFEFLNMIFQENAVIVGNDEISAEFNGIITGRLLVVCDETRLEDKANLTEKFKFLSTAQKVVLNEKGVNQVIIDNFSKYAFCSNNETRFIHTSQTETRFWVRKIPVLPENTDKNTDFKRLLFEEIPAFLQYLNQRKIFAPNVSRQWFGADITETDALRKLRQQQKPFVQKRIEEYIHDLLIDTRKHQLHYTIADLLRELPELEKKHSQLEYILTDNLQLVKSKEVMRYKIYSISKEYSLDGDSNIDLKENIKFDTRSVTGRCYEFPKEKFLTADEILNFFTENDNQINVQTPTQEDSPF